MDSISPTLCVLCVPLLPTNPVLSLPGISRENSTASARPGSAMSGASARTPGAQVRLRSAGARRPRPMSIATTGMTSSMYEERQKPALVLRDKSRTCEYLDILCILCQQSFVCSLPFSMAWKCSKKIMMMICVLVNTPKADRMKRARSVTSDSVAGDNEDTRSVSSAASGTRTPSRKTPSQVKAENAARKSKVII